MLELPRPSPRTDTAPSSRQGMRRKFASPKPEPSSSRACPSRSPERARRSPQATRSTANASSRSYWPSSQRLRSRLRAVHRNRFTPTHRAEARRSGTPAIETDPGTAGVTSIGGVAPLWGVPGPTRHPRTGTSAATGRWSEPQECGSQRCGAVIAEMQNPPGEPAAASSSSIVSYLNSRC